MDNIISFQWLHLIIVVAGVSTWWKPANSDPQIYDLGHGCSSVYAKNKTEYDKNLNATFSELRIKLSIDQWFATQEVNASDQIYAMVQCRKYLSVADCLTCYDAAVLKIRNCVNATGARVTYDGCFLRYEGYSFYTKSSDNNLRCSDTKAAHAFREEGVKFLKDLELATPKTKGFFAASKKEINKEENLTIYGVAQCVEKISPEACRSCMALAYESIQQCLDSTEGRLVDAGCFMRFSDTSFVLDNQLTDIKPFLVKPSSKNKAIIGGVGGGAGLAVIIITSILWYTFSRKLKIATRDNILGATELHRPNRYTYRELEAATNNFSEENKIGQGAFGAVYKATLRNGIILAVKKLDISHSRAKEDFESEARLISNVHHRNLLRLLGCCSRGSELLLVYEYMENGSLDKFLFGEKRGSLSWKQRFDIILGTARGIAYLHENYHVTILHRDIKPSNILLNPEFQAKIADFGLVRHLPESRTHVSTKFAGTLGYTAPEYAINGHLSEKVDVYSFGIVTLEIISGRRCSDVRIEDSEAESYLLRDAWKLYESGKHHKLADEALKSDEYEEEDLKKMVEIALACTQSPASLRPTMSEIVVMILSDRSAVEQLVPRRPSFDWERVRETGVGENAISSATVSLTQYTGR